MDDERFRSGDALVAFDRDLTVSAWNAAAERLTGIRAADALGRKCWDVLRGVDERGNVVCHPRCAGAREALAGRPPPAQRLRVRGAPVLVSTIATGDGFLHVLTDIRTLLRELDAHSQLEAVAHARRSGLIAD